MRGNKHDYDHWAALGNEGWSYEDVLPFFKKSEKNTGRFIDGNMLNLCYNSLSTTHRYIVSPSHR